MNESEPVLREKMHELENRLARIKKDISGGLDANFSEQATQLENRDVLLEIQRVTEEELATVKRKLATPSG